MQARDRAPRLRKACCRERRPPPPGRNKTGLNPPEQGAERANVVAMARGKQMKAFCPARAKVETPASQAG